MPVMLSIMSLFVIGFCLIFVEVVIIPGFGFAGVLGTVSLISASYIAFTSLSPLMGAIVTLTSLLMVFGLFKLLPKTTFWQKTRLSLTQNKKMGYQVATPGLENLIGKTGKTHTILRPSGTILIDGKHYDVVSDDEFIEKDIEVKVKNVQGNKITVTKVN
ncbi:MAG: hypothetical protein KAS13_07415 [Candidatus Omnitrophica bacterium]|nr:hypothetical protein [Candidatus Omnitrophota bacterium]